MSKKMLKSWLNFSTILILFGCLSIARTVDTQNKELQAPVDSRETHIRTKRDSANSDDVSKFTLKYLVRLIMVNYLQQSMFYRLPTVSNPIEDMEDTDSTTSLPETTTQAHPLKRPFTDVDEQNKNGLDASCAAAQKLRRKNITKEEDRVCGINIKMLNYLHPLILDPKVHEKLKYPDDNGNIFFKSGEEVFLSCVNNRFATYPFNYGIWTCVEGAVFKNIRRDIIYFLYCASFPSTKFLSDVKQIANKAGQLLNVLETTEYFPVEGEEKKLKFQTYVSKENDPKQLYYTRSEISRAIKGGQLIDDNPRMVDRLTGVPQEHTTYSTFYDKDKHNIAFERQLQSTKNSICSNRDNIERGQLIHKTSYVYEALSLYTFYFINYSPLWTTIFNNNWYIISRKVNEMASRNGDLTVITGTHEDLRVRNRDNTGTKSLYLNYNQFGGIKTVKEIPLKVFWFKIVIEPKSKSGIVFITINNPYLKNLPLYEICENPEFPSLSTMGDHEWDPRNVNLGYSYTCSVNSFFEGSDFPIRDNVTIGINYLLSVQ